MAINVCDVIWRQAFALYAIQGLVSCPWSSISLVWSHAARLHVDYLSGSVEIRNFGFVCHSRPFVMPMVQHQSRVVSRRRTTCGFV